MASKRSFLTPISASTIVEINRASILEMIRCNGPVSASELVTALQINLDAVIRFVDSLIKAGYVIDSTGRQPGDEGIGGDLIFNGAQHLVMGIDLGGTKIYGAIADLNGDIRHEFHLDHHETKAEASLELVCRVIDELMKWVQDTGLQFRGIGIGVPGAVLPDSGVVTLAPALDWVEFPLKARLSSKYDYPIAVENDVNLAALGEFWFGITEKVSDLVLLSIGTGIGAGIIIDGNIHRGANDLAGEVGYFIPDRACLDQTYPGFGALETLASGSGIADRARGVLQGLRSNKELNGLASQDVFESARNGAEWAKAVVNETIDYLAQLVAAVTTILDPDLIILSGGVSESADLLIEPIRARLAGTIPLVPQIQISQLGYQAAIKGAVIRLLHITFNYASWQRFI